MTTYINPEDISYMKILDKKGQLDPVYSVFIILKNNRVVDLKVTQTNLSILITNLPQTIISFEETAG